MTERVETAPVPTNVPIAELMKEHGIDDRVWFNEQYMPDQDSERAAAMIFFDGFATGRPDRIKPMLENMVRIHGFESRCASIRTTPLSVLDCEEDPAAAEREILREAKLAIAEDHAEAILLGCGGMGPLDQTIGRKHDFSGFSHLQASA